MCQSAHLVCVFVTSGRTLKHWDEIRTAYAVAREGTVSEAAEQLGVHRATVVRHIDHLEEALRVKLFQRHPRGYTPTEAGEDLLRVARATAEQFRDMEARIRGRTTEVSGELVVTSIEVVSPIVLSALRALREVHPDTSIRFAPTSRLYRLEYGEAHVAIRSGPKPTEPDNVVEHFMTLRSALYADQSYVDRRGRPAGMEAFAEHDFIDNPNTAAWSDGLVPPDRVVFSTTRSQSAVEALRAGIGIGFYPTVLAEHVPGLVQVHPPDANWDVPLWLVTHVDLHRTAKVQALLRHLRAAA